MKDSFIVEQGRLINTARFHLPCSLSDLRAQGGGNNERGDFQVK